MSPPTRSTSRSRRRRSGVSRACDRARGNGRCRHPDRRDRDGAAAGPAQEVRARASGRDVRVRRTDAPAPPAGERDRSTFYSPGRAADRRRARRRPRAGRGHRASADGCGRRTCVAFIEAGAAAAGEGRPAAAHRVALQAGRRVPRSRRRPTADRPDQREPMSPMRQAIAAPHGRLAATRPRTARRSSRSTSRRRRAARRAAERDGAAGVTSPTSRSSRGRRCEALAEHPLLNASVDGEEIVYHDDVNLGIAVALDDGLIVPVIRRGAAAQPRGHGGGDRRRSPSARASGALEPDEVHGGTFTITNPGQFGAVLATPIINQPQVAILDLEAIVKRPVVVERDGDAIAIRPMTYLRMSWDHRALDGAEAARFLALDQGPARRREAELMRRRSQDAGGSPDARARSSSVRRGRAQRRADRRSPSTRPRSARPSAGAACGTTTGPTTRIADALRLVGGDDAEGRRGRARPRRRQGRDLRSGRAASTRRASARDALLDFGDLVESLGGRYVTAEDVGIDAGDMAVIAERTAHVTGCRPSAAARATPARSPRVGVEAAMRACVARPLRRASPGRRRGRRRRPGPRRRAPCPAARRSADAELIVADVDPRKRAVAEALGARWVEPARGAARRGRRARALRAGRRDRRAERSAGCAARSSAARRTTSSPSDSLADELARARHPLRAPTSSRTPAG